MQNMKWLFYLVLTYIVGKGSIDNRVEDKVQREKVGKESESKDIGSKYIGRSKGRKGRDEEVSKEGSADGRKLEMVKNIKTVVFPLQLQDLYPNQVPIIYAS